MSQYFGLMPILRGDARGARLRVENIHYDLTEEDLDVCPTRNATL
jgi:hypothetical protein